MLLHLVADLCALTALLLLSQAGRNPLIALFYLNAALGPLILSGMRNVLFLLATCICFTVVSLFPTTPENRLHAAAVSREVTLAAELTVVLVIWQLTRWVAAQLADLWENLRELEHQKSKIDNLRALGAMAASFSHRFATPLNTVKLRLDRLSRPALGRDEMNVDLASAKAAVQQCESALRSLFYAEPGASTARVDEISLAPFVENVCRYWQHDHLDIQFGFNADKGARASVCRIPGLVLTRSLIDLLDNAVQASRPGAAAVEVSVQTGNEEAQIEIADRGCGMSSEVKSRLGEPFISTRETGSGLGLFTAQSLAKAYGGDLKVRDREGGGTVVSLSLPILGGVG